MEEIKNNQDYALSRIRKSKYDYSSAAVLYDRKGKTDSKGYRNLNLAIFQNNALIHLIIGKVVDYRWSPDGKSLVYMMGDYVGSRRRGETIGIYHVDKHKDKKIITSPDSLYWRFLRWAAFDSNIYIGDLSHLGTRVFRLDVNNKKIIPTDYQGIMFSPNGKYYFDHSSEGEPVILYERLTNKEIWNSEKARIPLLRKFVGWHIDSNDEVYLYLQSRRFGVGKIQCKTGNMEFIKRLRKNAHPILKNGDILWR